jgi:hypothetical protein
MRKPVLVAFCLLLFVSFVCAQKIDTKWHCSKPAQNPSLAVGDTPDHTYELAQGTCDATAGTSGDKSGAWTEFRDSSKTYFSVRGRFNVTADNGDMVYYTYDYSGKPDAKNLANKWKIVSGTGKHKGIHGSGSCSGTLNGDGSSDWKCTGTTSTAAAAAPAKKS